MISWGRGAVIALGLGSILISALPPGVWAATIVPTGRGTVSIGPQAMEGNLQIRPGDTLRTGYDFTMPGSHPAATVTVENASVKVSVTCSNGTTPPPIAISLPAQAYSDSAGSPSWYPSGDQSSSLVYQGSLTAPNLCSGGVMSAAPGALFQASFISTDIVDMLNVRFHYSDNTSGSWSATTSVIPSPIAKTYTSATLTPALATTLTVNQASAIPGDTLTYSGTVTNSGSTLLLTGDFFANGTGTGTTTVAGYWDEFATSVTAGQWTPFAGFAASQSGYSLVTPAPIATGMSLSAASVPSPGVSYPLSGDAILGTTLPAGSAAQWHYQASLSLTPSQVNFLLDPTKVKNVRNSFHLEVTPSNGTPATVDIDFTDFFLGATPPPSGAVNNVTVTVQPPGAASPISITSATVPALSSLASGASANFSTTFSVPAVSTKGTSETDSAYLARLAAVEGSALGATATAAGSSTAGTVTSPQVSTSSTEHLPIVTIAKTGPPSADAGTTATYPLTLNNTGGAQASTLAVTDNLPGGATGTVSGVPNILASGAKATAQATYAIPPAQSPGNLSDTAAITWQDAHANTYGPVSSSYSTSINNSLIGATLSLSPKTAGPILTGNAQGFQATLLNRLSLPVANRTITFAVNGANSASGTATTDASGNASFTYTGTNSGTDAVQASVPSTSPILQSNTASVSWVTLSRPVTTTPVQGNFYNINFPYGINIPAGSVPVFSQTFPDIAFNPPPDAVPNNIAGLGGFPFTDVTTDLNGNYTGTLLAQGNGYVAGAGNLQEFQLSLTGTFNVAAAGNIAFQIHASGAMVFGIGNGATQVSGEMFIAPSATAVQGYPVMSARNKDQPMAAINAVVHFPAAGSYPYEIDYTQCCGDASLTLRSGTEAADPTGLSVFSGYAEEHPGGPLPGFTPTPWQGSANTNFYGSVGSFNWDNGAIRIDNPATSPVTLDDVSVDIGSRHFDLWGSNLIVPAGGSLVLAQMGDQTFDTSDLNVPSCTVYASVPVVHVKLNGVVHDYSDLGQVLNTFGYDYANCSFGNESQNWAQIPYTPVGIRPVAPANTIALTPATAATQTVGQSVTFAAAAMDSSGRPVANLPLTLAIAGPNGGQLSATTDSSGFANFSYVGVNPGTDSVQVAGTIGGSRTVSNVTTIPWNLPPGPSPGTSGPPPPSITAPSPSDGATVTKPVPISATFTPPPGQTIASWSVSYQALDPSAPVMLASGSGTPPATLATFDPTLLPNDTYAITISATASGGGTQTLTTSVIVFGNLKLGRYVTTYQDLNVPVSGYQMQLRRTYDSLDKRTGDFGVGWKVELVNFRTSTNRALGAGGWTQYDTLCAIGLCLTAFQASAPHFVVVVFPDGHDEIFDFTPTGGTNVFLGGGAAFTARPGTTSTLQAYGNSSLSYSFDGNLYDSTGAPYNPQRFLLTTQDGHTLLLDRSTGLVSETDRNGNSLSVDSTGVHSSSGASITLTRDASNGNRITAVTGPSGEKLAYTYDAVGNLSTSTDPAGNITTYSYDSNHDLLSATGPTQSRPLTTLAYDSSGRLTGITDGNGNTTQVSSNVAGQQQTVTDAAGRLTTIYTLDDIGDIVRQDQIFDGKTLTSTATYDAVGRPLSRTDPLGHTWTGSYDGNGNLLQLSGPQSDTVRLAYDQYGAPLSFSDPLGNGTSYGYDANGNLTSFTNALGQTETYGYDANGNLISRTDGLKHTWKYTVDGNGNRTSMTDPLGNVTTYSYDNSGRLLDQKDPLADDTSYIYDGNGNLLSTRDALGQTTSMTYDAQGNMLSRTDAGGNTTTYTYDGNNKLTASKDPLGRITSYSYDADGRLATVTDPAGGVTTYSYDGSGRLSSEKDAIGRVTSYSYDDGGRLASKTMPNGGVYSYGYDADGHQTSVTDPLNHVSTTSYDTDGNVTSSVDPLGNITRYTIDALGRQVQTTDPLGQLSSQAYDAAGQLISTTDAAGHATTYGYDAAGNRTSVTDPLGHATTYTLDAAARMVASTDALGRKTQFGYDALGRLTSTTSPSGMTTTYTYDALGHETSVTDPLGDTGRYGYDAAGQRTSSTDALNHTTSYAYDGAGRMTSITDALGGKVTISFDAAGQQTSIVNPRGDTTSFTYDPLGNIATQTNPAGKVATMTYDAAGRLITKVDARGISVGYGYDAAGNQTSTSFPGGSITQAFDALGRRTSMTDPTGTTSFGYDAASNVTAVAAPQGTVSYTYDAANRRTSMTLPGSRTVSYSYDAANQLTGLTDWFNQATSITYTSDGLQSVMTRPAGIKTTYGYDNADRLTSVNNDGPSGPLKDFSYILDAAGNRTSVTSAAGTESYMLDALNRLTQVTYPNGDKVSYTYDAAGNRLSDTVNGVTTNYGYNSAGQLTTVGATTYGYDADGNLISAGANSFSWDWAGQLAQASVAGTASSYTYDGNGLRVAATTGSASASYLWDRTSPLPTLVDDGTSGFLQLPSGSALEQLSSSGVTAAVYPLVDALGSSRGSTSASSTLTGSIDYTVFGALRTSSGTSSIFGFAGAQTDPTGLLFLRTRYDNPILGRFISPDTVIPNTVGTQGFDLYQYAANNPTTLLDPTGHSIAISYGRLALLAAAASSALRATATILVTWLIRAIVALSIAAAGECALGLPPVSAFPGCQGPIVRNPARPRAAPTAPVIPTVIPFPIPTVLPTTAPSPTPSNCSQAPRNLVQNEAAVVHGGENLIGSFLKGSGVWIDSEGYLHDVSVQSAAGVSVGVLAGYVKNKQIGVSTVAAIRGVGGYVQPDEQPGLPYHALLSCITPFIGQMIFTPTEKNPSPYVGP